MAIDTTELSLASLELDKLEACVELMFFAAHADGTVDATERAAFEKITTQVTHGQLRPEIVRAVLSHFESHTETGDRTARVRAIADRLPDKRMRSAMLSLAATVALADGKVMAEESAFLREAGAIFGLDAPEIDALLARA